MLMYESARGFVIGISERTDQGDEKKKLGDIWGAICSRAFLIRNIQPAKQEADDYRMWQLNAV